MTTTDAPRPALDAAGLTRIADVLRVRTQPSTLWLDQSGASIVQEADGKLRTAIRLRYHCRSNTIQDDRDMEALSVLWNTADALLAAAAERDALAREAAQLREAVNVLCDEDQRKLLELERLRAALPSPCPEHGIDHMGLTRRWGWLNRPAADSVPVWACHHEGIPGESDCDFWHQITTEGYAALAPQEGDGNGR